MPASEKELVPDKLRSFVELGFEFDRRHISGREAFGDCVFCGGVNKLYINIDTGMWECKKCLLKGNIYSFIKMWYDLYRDTQNAKGDQPMWVTLANDRQLDPDVLKASGIVYDGNRFAIPIRNINGSIVNLQLHEVGEKIRNLPGLEVGMWGMEKLGDESRKNERVFICEGSYDAIALEYLLRKTKQKGIVVSSGSAGTWKQTWTDAIKGRKIINCYDHDTAGEKGTDRMYGLIRARVQSYSHIIWPNALPEGFDIRDFVTKDGSYRHLISMVAEYTPREIIEDGKTQDEPKIPISSADRPNFSEVVNTYQKHIHMTQDLIDALKITYATVLSAKIEGDPLWVHLVGPPGSGKTLILLSTTQCSNCYFVSTLTPNSLVSGFSTGGEDPSLLPKLNNKVLVVKDYTEILALPKDRREELFGTLRGAYDGETSKQYGNGITRVYKSRFNVVTGVTQQIYAERSASLGERFLMFHVVKGVGFDAKLPIRTAIRNVGREIGMNTEIAEIAKRFLDVEIDSNDLPVIEEWVENRIIALSQFVAMLRASVERDARGQRKLLYRPQHEMGTRLAKQFAKLLLGLGLINNPIKITSEEYRILTRVAIDTCVGFNLEAIASLVEKPGQTMKELSADCRLAISTLADQVEDLIELGVIEIDKELNPAGRGAPINRYYPTKRVSTLWKEAGLTRINGQVKALAREKRKINVRTKRVKVLRRAK